MKPHLILACSVLSLLAASPISAITITFEGLADNASIGSYYNGGGGGSQGAVFTGVVSRDSDAGGTGSGIANEPSASNVWKIDSAAGRTMTVSNGFIGLSFRYSAKAAGSYTVWDGPNATGNQIASGTLSITATGSGDPNGSTYATWPTKTVSFNGPARSLKLVSGAVSTGGSGSGGLSSVISGPPDYDTMRVDNVKYTLASQPVISSVTAGYYNRHTAVFNAQVNAQGLTTSVGLEYGPTAALGQSVAAIPSGFAGSGNTAVGIGVENLVSGQTIYYRFAANNGVIGPVQSPISTYVHTGAESPDLTFGGGDGIVITSIQGTEEGGQGLAVQADGKIVVAGFVRNGSTDDFAVLRYNVDGTPDSSFGGGDGVATVDFSSQSDYAYSVALQSDGKIVVAGESYNGIAVFAVARLHGDIATGTPGDLDNSFDGDGRVTTAIGVSDVPSSVVVQPDGKILVGGYSYNGSNADFAVVRYTSTGSLDTATFGATGTTFTGSGKVTTAIGSGDDYGLLALQPDGKIVMSGRSHNGSNNDFAVARYNSNGTLDTGFGTSGKTTTPIGSGDDNGTRMVIQPDGKIVVSGTSHNGSNTDFALARYTTAGVLDATFGTGGKATAAIGSGEDQGRNIAIQSDGKLIMAGDIHNGSNNDFGVVRFNPDGSLDATFDGDGKNVVPIGSGEDVVRGLGVQTDGRIVVVGRTHNGTNNDIAVVRLLGGDRPLLVNGSFEANELLGGGAATGLGDWRRDHASTALTENGITPYEGTRMLQFMGTGDTGASSDTDANVAQYVDLSSYAAQIAAGTVSVKVRARFNRVTGNASTDTAFKIVLTARSGTAATGTDLGSNTVTLTSDADTSTWEELTNNLALPAGTTHFLLNLAASENVVNDTASTEFAGHYADAVLLAIEGADIQVQQGEENILADGQEALDMGTTPLGVALTRTFTISNPSLVPLHSLAVTLDGTNAAEFQVTQPLVTTLAPAAATTFTVTFTPGGPLSGPRTAAFHITSNDEDESPFDVPLAGIGLSTTADGDGDGLNDWAEHSYTGLGFDWQSSQPELVESLNTGANSARLYDQTQYDQQLITGQQSVITNPNPFNLFTPAQIQALNVTAPLIQRHPTTGEFTLTLGLEKSTTLLPGSFTPFPMTTPQTIINGQGKLEFKFTVPDNAAFFRLQAQ